MKQCGYCKSRSILKLNSKYYCETCEIYYTYKDGKQEYSNLPIEEIDQMTVGDYICKSCRPKYFNKSIIPCATYREYFKRLPLCSKCKKNNERCIKNAFFKNFILYKAYVRVFSVQYIVFYTVWFYLLRRSAIFGVASINLIDHRRGELNIFRSLLKSILVVVLHYWPHGNVLCYIYCLISMLVSKRWIYEVPVNLDQSPPNLLEYLEQLNIGNPRRRSYSS